MPLRPPNIKKTGTSNHNNSLDLATSVVRFLAPQASLAGPAECAKRLNNKCIGFLMDKELNNDINENKTEIMTKNQGDKH